VQPRASARGRDVIAAIVPAAVCAVLYRPVLFAGQAFFDRDIVGLVYGSAEAFVSCFRAGSWPVWNPWVGFGQPLLADPSAQAAYPVTWLNLLLPVTTWFTASVVLHAAWGALGMAAAARGLGLARGASVVAASLWLGAGPLLSIVDMWQHFDGAAWLPWSLLAAGAALRRPAVGRTVVWGVVLALQVLCGSVEMLLASLALTPVLALAGIGQATPGRRVRTALTAGLLAAGLSAVQWVPALELLLASQRARHIEATRTNWSLHPAQLVQHLVPLRSSELPIPEAARPRVFAGTEPMQESLYLGLATVALVLAAFLHRPGRRLALLLSAVGAAAILLALGAHTPLVPAMLRLVPPLRIFRFPAKFTVLTAFAWALLAALGADAWARGTRAGRAWGLGVAAPATILALLAGAAALALLAPGPARSRVLLAAALAGAVAALAWLSMLGRWRAPAAIVVPLLACADVALANGGVSPTAPQSLLESRPASTGFMPRTPFTRVHALETNALLALPWQGLSAPQAWALAVQEAMAGATPVRWGYSAAFGTNFVVTPSPRYVLMTRALEQARGTAGFLRLLRQSGVSYVIAEEPAVLEGLVPVATLAGPFAVPVHVLRVPDPLPRAYVSAETVIADDATALRLLLDGTVAGERRSVLPGGAPTPPSPGQGEAEIVSYAPDRVEIAARLDGPAHLVLLDAWDAGWRASVDGHPAALERANVEFRALPLPAGEHRVLMRYRPASLLAGLGLSSVSALLLAVLGGAAALGRLARGSEGPTIER